MEVINNMLRLNSYGEGKNQFFINIGVFCLFFLLISGSINIDSSLAAEKKLVGIREIFIQIEQSLLNKDKAAFKALWFSDGWHSNPTGKSGYSGEMAFEQGTTKGWFIKPDFKKILITGLSEVILEKDVVIIPSHVWSFENHKAIRDIYTSLVNNGTNWLILGLSENSKDLEEMVKQFKNPWGD